MGWVTSVAAPTTLSPRSWHWRFGHDWRLGAAHRVLLNLFLAHQPFEELLERAEVGWHSGRLDVVEPEAHEGFDVPSRNLDWLWRSVLSLEERRETKSRRGVEALRRGAADKFRYFIRTRRSRG